MTWVNDLDWTGVIVAVVEGGSSSSAQSRGQRGAWSRGIGGIKICGAR